MQVITAIASIDMPLICQTRKGKYIIQVTHNISKPHEINCVKSASANNSAAQEDKRNILLI